MNRTGKTKASKGVENNYNDYKEFNLQEIKAHICASFMQTSGMLNMEGKSYTYNRMCVYTLIFHCSNGQMIFNCFVNHL